MPYKNILVPTDFSAHAELALETALEFSKALDAKVHLVHAYFLDVPPSYVAGGATAYFDPQAILEPIRERSVELIEELTKNASARGFDVSAHVVMGRASQVILDEVRRIPADMIVMGTRGLTGLKHALLGSTAERVVRMAPCPVVTVKAPDRDDA